MNSRTARIAVMAPAGETPESWMKFKVECLAVGWRADARAHTWRSVAYIGLCGWVLFIPLAVQVFAPGIVPWVMAHGYSMSLVVAAAVFAILIYGVVEAVRGLQAVRRNKRKVVSA